MLRKLISSHVAARLMEDSPQGPAIQFAVHRDDERLTLALRTHTLQLHMTSFLPDTNESKLRKDLNEV